MIKIIGYIIRKIMKIYWNQFELNIPKFEIQNKHLVNTKMLPNREQLLENLPKNGIVAELGVDNGKFSEKILEINKPKILHLIDSWDSRRYSKNKEKKVFDLFKHLIKKGLVQIHVGLAEKVSNDFKDDYFDWIYIDTSHCYSETINELNHYSKKMKSGGIIAGHDYIIGNWNGMVRYGVIEAVHEFCVQNDWEIIYLTMEINENPSFAIKNIN